MIPPAPSGKQASGYEEILIRVWKMSGEDKAEVAICTQEPRGPSFYALMVATENMIRVTAQKSNAGYEEAIGLLVEAAMLKNKGKFIGNTDSPK